jgi:hypothetical protein
LRKKRNKNNLINMPFRYRQRRTKMMSFRDWYFWTVIETQNELNSTAVPLLTCTKRMHFYLNRIFLVSIIICRFHWQNPRWWYHWSRETQGLRDGCLLKRMWAPGDTHVTQ